MNALKRIARHRRQRHGTLAAGIVLLFVGSAATADDYAAEPSPRQAAVLEALRAAADGPVEARFRRDGTLRYLGGRNVAPGCKAPKSPLDVESAAALATCFFERYGELVTASTQPGEPPVWRASLFAPTNDAGFSLLRIQQLHGDLPIANATMTLNIRDGVAVSFVGRLYRREDLVLWPGLPAPQDVLAAAQAASGRSLSFLKRLYDPSRSTVLSLFVDQASTAELVVFDDLAMKLIGVFLPQSDSLNHVQKFADVARYDLGGDKWGRDLAPASTTEVLVHWEPFTSRFCKAFLDWGSELEDGEPKVFDLNGGQPWAVGVPAERTQTCSSNGTFPGYPDGGHPAPGQWVNAYFWMHDLAEFARHAESGYKAAYPWTAAENLLVIASTGNPCFGDDPAACLHYGFGLDFDGDVFTEYRIILPVPANAGEVAASNRLSNMAHEHGHLMHNMYDRHYLGIVPSFLDNSLNEGFADHNILRYALHRHFQWADRPHDMNFSTTYEEDHWERGDRDHREMGFYNNGERVPAPMAGLGASAAQWRSMVFAPWDSTTSCHSASGDDEYVCGSVVGRVFWTLAWNRIRVAFNGIAEGTTILQGTGGDALARRLASEAYTYAIRAVGDSGGDVDDFFNLVSEFYSLLGQDGTLSGDDVHRVDQVLNVHCVGWSSDNCRDLHKTVWQRLPVALTTKATFAETGTEEYLRADEQMDHWDVDTIDFGTHDGARFVRIEPDPYEGIGGFLDFPVDGCYQVHAAARSQTSGARLWVNTEEPGSERTWWISDQWLGHWGWLHDGPAFWVAAGNRGFALRGQQGTVDVEAVLVRLMPGVNQAACSGFVPPPPRPSSLTVTSAQCFGGVDLSWTVSPSATSYELEADINIAFTNPSTIYTGPDTHFPWDIGTTTRYFRVKACIGSVCSNYRNGNTGASYVPTCH